MGRRTYSREFKVSAVGLVQQQGYTVVQAAKSLGVDPASLRGWLKQFPLDGAAPADPVQAELRRLREEVRRLTMEREISKKSDGLLRQGVAMRYRFIDDHRATWPVEVQCRVLEVSRSGYYAWRRRPVRRQIELTDRIRQIHGQRHHGNYGAPRIHRELVAQGYSCNRKTVEKLMCRAGIRAKTCRRFRVMTTDSRYSLPIAPNRLARQFQPTERHRAWTMDITYIETDEGWLYLALVEDLYSRKILGWATSERIDSQLVAAALNRALEQERPGAGLLAHSDRGVQYASDRFQSLLARRGITCSMSRKRNCWDNAPTESLIATIKKELVHQEHYATRDAARRSLFEYIEVFYNRQRRHSTLDYQTPEALHSGRHREEGRGGLGERGRVSPKSKNNRGNAAPLITNQHH